MDDFDIDSASDEQVTLFLARSGVSPLDTKASLEKALKRVREEIVRCRDERPWEEFELGRVDNAMVFGP